MGQTIDEYLAALPAPMTSGGRTSGSTTEICKRIRSELSGAVAAGVIPAGVTFSVRKDHHKSITVSIETWPGTPLDARYAAHLMECIAARMRGEKEPDFDLMQHNRIRLNDGHHHSLANPRLSMECNRAWADASRIANRHNHDYSDSMTDHFDVGYYLDVTTHGLIAIAERGIRAEMDPQYADLVRRAVAAANTLSPNVVKSECGRMPVEFASDWTLARLIDLAAKFGGKALKYDKRRRKWVVDDSATVQGAA